jgi:hypothetical protein
MTTHITADMTEELIRVTDLMRNGHGRIYTVSGWTQPQMSGETQYVVELHVPLSLLRYASGWRVLWAMVEATASAWWRI